MINPNIDDLRKINLRCQQFLTSSTMPLYKEIDAVDVQRVKVRFRKAPVYGMLLDTATRQQGLSEKIVPCSTAVQSAYLFPSDGFKCMWSSHAPMLEQTLTDIATALPEIDDQAAQLVSGMLNTGLPTEHNVDVFLYGMADFYVVPSTVEYDLLLEAIHSTSIPTHYQ